MAYIQIANSRGGKALILDSYRYLRNKITPIKMYWRCARRECNVYMTTAMVNVEEDDPAIVILKRPSEHGHEPETDLVATTGLTEQMLLQVVADSYQPVRRIYDRVAVQAADVQHVPPFEAVRSRLVRKRGTLMPPIPNTVEEVVVENEWAESWSGAHFLSKNSAHHGFLVFATDNNFAKLSECQQIYMDGTFKTCPRPYEQFVTIHGHYLVRAVPLVMVLMSGRTEVLRHVKRKIERVTGQRWSPCQVVTDFEMGLMQALRAELLNIRTQGCYFHLCQSRLWRKVQELGLAAPYRRDRKLRDWVRKTMVIGYLPLAVVRQNFRLMVAARITRRLARVHPQLNDFIQYMEHTYVAENALFPPAMWSVHGRVSDNRTNNFVEGFHPRWNTAMDRCHPSLWVFIRRLKDEQQLVEMVCANAECGDPPLTQRRKWRRLKERLQRLRRHYHLGNRTLEQYWDALQYCIVNFE